MKRGEVRVAALLAAGASVLAERGYDAATMTEIAARAGASIGSLYQFFPTKALLAARLHEDLLAVLSTELEALAESRTGRSPGAMAGALFDLLSAFLAAHPAFEALAERRDIDPEKKRATRALLRRRIATLLAGAQPPIDPARTEAVAAIILHLMKGAVALGREDDPAVRDVGRAELRRMLTAYLEAG